MPNRNVVPLRSPVTALRSLRDAAVEFRAALLRGESEPDAWRALHDKLERAILDADGVLRSR
jgi:hypothetical protein